jgi:hypothetical protein
MDATEQALDTMTRITLQGTEFALRLSGAGAKRLAAALIAAALGDEKSKGKTRLAALLKSGKELKVFQVKASDLGTFAEEARRYGVVYAVVKPLESDKRLDVMVKAADAAKVNRIAERLGYGEVTASDVVAQIERSREGKAADGKAASETEVVDLAEAERITDELFGAPADRDGQQPKNPTEATMEAPHPSEPISKTSGHSSRDTERDGDRDGHSAAERSVGRTQQADDGRTQTPRRSVKAEMEKIRAERKDGTGDKTEEKTVQKAAEHVRPTKTRGKRPAPDKKAR